MKKLIFILLSITGFYLFSAEKGYDFELYDMGDSLYTTKKIRAQEGTKAVVVDFFSIQCDPCKKALPEWINTYREYHKKGLQIILVILPVEDDRDEEFQKIEAFLKKTTIPFTVLYDKYKVVGKQYGIIEANDSVKIPQVFLLDKESKLIKKAQGHSEIIKEIKTILK